MALLNDIDFLNELLELLLVFLVNKGRLFDVLDFEIHPLNGIL